ncbi:hypothetical protein ACFL6S_02980 [Candidatus Poribacteria bacterium]
MVGYRYAISRHLRKALTLLPDTSRIWHGNGTIGYIETTVEENINQFRKHGGTPEERMKRGYDGLVSETDKC